MTTEFTEEQTKILEKVEKLLRLAAKNANENEAAAATARAMALLEAYNLDMSSVDVEGTGGDKRAEEKLLGGRFKFERDPWKAISDLNFVWYFTNFELVRFEERHLHHKKRLRTHKHVLIGKVANIAATKAMAGYLAQAIERLTEKHIQEMNVLSTSSWAVSFRQGVAERIIEKLNRRRWDQLDAEEQRHAEAGIATVETALTLATVKEREDEGNYDFIHGKGAWAERRRSEAEWHAKRAAAREAAEAAYTKWAAENPEEAKREEAKRIRAARRRDNYKPRGWGRTGSVFKGDWAAYSMGREVGTKVGIDPQTKGGSKAFLKN